MSAPVLGPLATRALVAITLLCVAPAAAPAQSRYAVLPEPDGTAVGVAVVLNAGSPWELESESGLSYLTALATVEEVRDRLEALGGHIEASCLRTATTFALVLPRDTWRRGTQLFLDALFNETLSEAAVERARTMLAGRLVAQDDFTPEIEAALSRALFGAGNRWSRPSCGTATSVVALDADAVNRLRRARYRPTRAVAAIVGPAEEVEAHSALAPFTNEDDLPVLVPAPASPPADGYVPIVSPTVTTWVALAFPFPEGTDTEALRLLAFHIREEFGPDVARPDVYDLTTSIERHGDGGWLTVTLITESERARRREAEVRARVKRLAERALPDRTFDALLVRFRGARLLELAGPEARARDAALQLFFDQKVVDPSARSASLNRNRLRRSAAALGAPASASLGPR